MHKQFANSRLLTKLLAIVAAVIACATIMGWLSIEVFAFNTFAALLDKYDVPQKDEVLRMFMEAAHRGLLWGALHSLVVGLSLGYLLARWVLAPLHQIIAVTRKITHGDYMARVHVARQDEFGELGLAFNAMTENLQRIELLRKNMVVDIAHELRAPLTNIRGYLEALTNGAMALTPAILSSLQEESLRLGNLTEDLMRLSVADSARLTLQRETINVPELLGHMLTLFQSQFAEKAITVETRYSGAVEKISADSEKLAQVFQNLLDNALRYTPRGGSVRISIEKTAGSMKAAFRQYRRGDLG